MDNLQKWLILQNYFFFFDLCIKSLSSKVFTEAVGVCVCRASTLPSLYHSYNSVRYKGGFCGRLTLIAVVINIFSNLLIH